MTHAHGYHAGTRASSPLRVPGLPPELLAGVFVPRRRLFGQK